VSNAKNIMLRACAVMMKNSDDYGPRIGEITIIGNARRNNMEFVLHGRIPSKKNSRVTLPDGRTIPSSDYSRWQREARKLAKYTWLRAPTAKPVVIRIETNCRNDADNLASSVLDMLEGVFYENDRQVREIIVKKRKKERGEDYRTVIRVEVLD